MPLAEESISIGVDLMPDLGSKNLGSFFGVLVLKAVRSVARATKAPKPYLTNIASPDLLVQWNDGTIQHKWTKKKWRSSI